MASDAIASGADRPRGEKQKNRTGFFQVYKRGQGYWTRMGTAAAAGLIAALAIRFMYQYLPVWIGPLFRPAETVLQQMEPAARTAATTAAEAMAHNITLGVCAAFLLGFGLLIFRLLNKPDYADFLIATDGEMKKVNWTTRKELMGSTKVVIFFMFLIAVVLFIFDIFFGYLFYFIDVLKSRPL